MPGSEGECECENNRSVLSFMNQDCVVVVVTTNMCFSKTRKVYLEKGYIVSSLTLLSAQHYDDMTSKM